MKLIIDIDDQEYNEIKEDAEIFRSKDMVVPHLYKVIESGIPLPKDTTNGDMIKALFPEGSQVKGASIYVMNDNKSNVFYDFDWWNATYKKENNKNENG